MGNFPQEVLLSAQALVTAMKRYMDAEKALDWRAGSLEELEDAAHNVMDAAHEYRMLG